MNLLQVTMFYKVHISVCIIALLYEFLSSHYPLLLYTHRTMRVNNSANPEIIRTTRSLLHILKYVLSCVCACACLLTILFVLSLNDNKAAVGINDMVVSTRRVNNTNYTAPLDGGIQDMAVSTRRVNNTNYTAPLEGKIKVFYNLFTKDAAQEGRVQLIVDEQLSNLDPGVHILEITSIGHRLPNIPDATIREHYKNGTEALTLHALWDYCKKYNNADTKVVYLHSKGSYHNIPRNKKLRRFLTKGALSKECSDLPNNCNVCSSRMSPLPHPHTSGNMWLARCDYVATLLDPNSLAEGKLPKEFEEDVPCKGWGRFFFEHWIHSHPSVMPCDLYPGKEYTWLLNNIPDVNFPMDLQMAPRFDLNAYKKRACDQSEGTTVGHRKWAYEKLYNTTTLDDSWWGWKTFKGEEHD